MTKGNDASSPVRLRTLREIERVALLHMDPVITEFLQGGSGAELTLERNRSDFDRIRFVPRVMSGCPYPSTSTNVARVARSSVAVPSNPMRPTSSNTEPIGLSSTAT